MKREKVALSKELVEKIELIIPAALAERVPKLFLGVHEGKNIYFVKHAPHENDKTLQLLGYYRHDAGDLLLAIEKTAA